MSALDTHDLTPEQARTLTDDIRTQADVLVPLVVQAYQGRAWRALGYESWDAYRAAEFPAVRVAVEARPDVARELRDAGMSQRQVAGVLGVNRETVSKDLNSMAGTQPSNGQTLMSGGREYTRSRAEPDPLPAAVKEAIAEHEAERNAKREHRAEVEALNAELGYVPDPAAEAELERRTRLLYPFFEAVKVIAAMPPAEGIPQLIEPYQQFRLDELPAALAWLSHFTQVWKETR